MTQPGQPYEQYEVPPAGQEYTGQYNPEPPYSAQPYSGLPQQPYNQPYSAPPQPFHEPGYPQPQPPVPPRHNSGLIALIASLGVLAVVAGPADGWPSLRRTTATITMATATTASTPRLAMNAIRPLLCRGGIGDCGYPGS